MRYPTRPAWPTGIPVHPSDFRFALPAPVVQAVTSLPCPPFCPSPAAETVSLRRQQELDTGRALAAQLLSKLGSRDIAVPVGPDRAPCWPAGYTGSITHTDDLLAVAVARCEQVGSIGIDLERRLDPDTAQEVAPLAITAAEDARLSDAGFDFADRVSLAFAAKEALFKCVYPLTGVFFDFADAEVLDYEPVSERITLRLTRTLSATFAHGRMFVGYAGVARHHVHAALHLPPC